ncbi:hypothetical protein GCM10010218_06920 [Streptomyces mashuensis]|uniref:NAD-dependent epimerase/dehydratase domain-containing protein n=1 Tax=Streptomyces mashuensis TaxID=33904 RepID=A0A919E9R6_9ACTN|nr:NAD(P)-dependent oxidoreductase [Streptomyces mashuensis]GHF28413.1 hypothetical protein GCM10010218_06920 [Streptomyces mashuensis]
MTAEVRGADVAGQGVGARQGAVLVTGAAGFVGRHTVEAFHRAGFRVTAVDLRPAPVPLMRAARWERADYADAALLAQVAAGRFGTVVHLATAGDEAAGPAEAALTGPARLADACAAGGARLLYASSYAVYGVQHRQEPLPEDAEDDRTRCSGPLGSYARSLLALDRHMRARHATGLDWAGLRCTHVFGPDEQDKGLAASFLSRLVRAAASRGRVRLYDDTLTAARDHLPVGTVTETLVLLARRPEPVPPDVYNLGSGHPVSFAELLQWCARARREAGGGALEVDLVANPAAATYRHYTCAGTTRLDKALPGRPTVTRQDVESRTAALFAHFSPL